jgi:hypothetical protein
MKWEYLNNGEAFPPGHRKEGQLGVTIDFEDGRPETQNVYAATQAELLDKVVRMYGNTQVRYAEVKRAQASSPNPPAAPTRLTAEQTIQNVADLDDPAKAGAAAVALIQEETGVDLRAVAAAEKAKQEATRMQGEVDSFMAANPE